MVTHDPGEYRLISTIEPSKETLEGLEHHFSAYVRYKFRKNVGEDEAFRPQHVVQASTSYRTEAEHDQLMEGTCVW
jgi:hypothetical protein